MKAPLITKIHYINPSAKTFSSHKSNHIKYIATNKDNDNPYSKNGEEKKVVDDEEVYTFKKDRDHHVKYAEYMVKDDKEELESGLFSYYGEADLDKALAEIKNHENTVYTAIISLREDDAKELGYDDPEKWIETAKGNVSRILKESFGFDYQNTKWYGAIHMKDGHPHMHLMFYEKERTKSYNTFKKKQLGEFKKQFASVFYKEKREDLFLQKDAIRDVLREVTGKTIGEIASDGLLNDEKDVVKDMVKKIKVKDKKILGGQTYLTRKVKNDLSTLIMDNQDKISKDSNMRYGYATKEEKKLTNEIIDFLLLDVLEKQRREMYEIKKELYSQYRKIDEAMEILILKEVNDEIRENIQNEVFRNLKLISKHNPYKLNEHKFKKYVSGVDFSSLSTDLEFKKKIALSKLFWNIEDKLEVEIMKNDLPPDLFAFYQKYKKDFELQKLLDRDIYLYPTELDVLDELDLGLNSDIDFYEFYATFGSRGIVDNVLADASKINKQKANEKYNLIFNISSEARRNMLKKEIKDRYPPKVAEEIIKKYIDKSAVNIALDSKSMMLR